MTIKIIILLTSLFLATFGQGNNCGCCTSKNTETIKVELTCQDGFKKNKTITVPLDCACTKGGCAENVGNKRFAPRSELPQAAQ